MGVSGPPLLLLCDRLARAGLVLVRIRLAPRLRLGRRLWLAELAPSALPCPLLPWSARGPSASWRAFALRRAFPTGRSLALDGSFSLDGSLQSGGAVSLDGSLPFDRSFSPRCAFASGRSLARHGAVRPSPLS